MKKPSFFVLISILLFVTLFQTIPPISAEPSFDQVSQNIDLIISKTGMEAQLTSIPAQFDDSLQKTKEKTKISPQLEAILKNDLTVESLLADIKQTFASGYNEKLISLID